MQLVFQANGARRRRGVNRTAGLALVFSDKSNIFETFWVLDLTEFGDNVPISEVERSHSKPLLLIPHISTPSKCKKGGDKEELF